MYSQNKLLPGYHNISQVVCVNFSLLSHEFQLRVSFSHGQVLSGELSCCSCFASVYVELEGRKSAAARCAILSSFVNFRKNCLSVWRTWHVFIRAGYVCVGDIIVHALFAGKFNSVSARHNASLPSHDAKLGHTYTDSLCQILQQCACKICSFEVRGNISTFWHECCHFLLETNKSD